MKTCRKCGTVWEDGWKRCVQCSRDKSRRQARSLNGRYYVLQRVARDRDLPMEISKEQHGVLLTLPCHYCQGPLSPTGCGLDRLNNRLGYIPGNVVPCCDICNQLKSNLLKPHAMEKVAALLKTIPDPFQDRNHI